MGASQRNRPANTLPAPFGTLQRRSRQAETTERPLATILRTQENRLPRQILPATDLLVSETEPRPRQMPRPETLVTPRMPRRRKRRAGSAALAAPAAKKTRTTVRKERTEEEWKEDVASVLRCFDEEFDEKERLSYNREWCTPIPTEKKVATVQAFYKAFRDDGTLPLQTCLVCYRKFGKGELKEISWDQWATGSASKSDKSPFACQGCFPTGEVIMACSECVSCVSKDYLSSAARVHGRLGCEHMFPEELEGLTPVEEKLISLNSCYGFITKYSIVEGQRQTASYPKHVKGHITIFPNNVQELVTRVLPHPLVKMMDEIHVSWNGARKPEPSDLSKLLSVRRRVVQKALAWLRINNPHYADIVIDADEMASWGSPPHDVPTQILEHMEHNEPTAWEKVRTAQIVPPGERGMEEDGVADIEDIMAMLRQEQQEERLGECAEKGNREADEGLEGEDDGARDGGRQSTNPAYLTEAIHEVSSSGMFTLDAQPEVADLDRLRFACEAVCEDRKPGLGSFRTAGMGNRVESSAGSTSVRAGLGQEPYISVCRGGDFADSEDPFYFAKTFPTLFPFGGGGPRVAAESIASISDTTAEVEGDGGRDATAAGLL
ncbi:hypothetical protein B0I35DRAFT_517610, partial [Stachybotrys elegans]